MSEEYSVASPGAKPAQPRRRDEPMLRIDVLSVHPEMFVGPFDASILRRAKAEGLVDIRVHDLRDWAHDRHRSTDDYAYGGGGGMVMKPEPVFEAVESLLDSPATSAAQPLRSPCPVLMMTPQGRPFDDSMARRLSREARIVILCGHYEGFDERIREHLVTEEVSLGDFVLTGGEIPAMLIVDAVTRLLPGVVGHAQATSTDSFADGLLEHPHYTRPADFRGWQVPALLLGGNHGEVARWRRREALRRTWLRRPELIAAVELDDEQRAWISGWEAQRATSSEPPSGPDAG